MQLKMTVEDLNAFMESDFGHMADEFTVEGVSAGEITVRMRVGAQHLRPGGTLSGPSMFSLADVSMYLAVLAVIGPVALAVTTNCSIDFMHKPAAGVDLIGKAQVLKLGKALAVGDVFIFSDGSTAPVARASLTYSIPPDR